EKTNRGTFTKSWDGHWRFRAMLPITVEYKLVIPYPDIWDWPEMTNRSLDLEQKKKHHNTAYVKMEFGRRFQEIRWCREELSTCRQPGCCKLTFNGQPNEYCSRSCKARGAPDITPIPFELGGTHCGLLAFYYPGKQEHCDVLCGAGFLGNFYDVKMCGSELQVSPKLRSYKALCFRTAESAFQALKFWSMAEEFQDLTGDQAFKRTRDLEKHGCPVDSSYSGYGNNWNAMLTVLRAKFTPGSLLAKALQLTDPAFLLEHNPQTGRDKTWSDNGDGSGLNWLGLQLMLIRDQICGHSGKPQSWTSKLRPLFNVDTGLPLNDRWQSAVQQASATLNSQPPA
ncbi:unnamed protein product, partial [Polarella glacialis]